METATMNKTVTLVNKAHALMEERGLLDMGWKISFNNNKSTAGICNYSKRTIFLSRFYLEHGSMEKSWDTITHEIAHALVGPGHGHGYVWRTQHIKLGGSGNRGYVLEGKVKEAFKSSAKWTGICPRNSEHTVSRNRLTKTAKSSSCSRCSTTFNKDLIFVWEQNY